MESRPDYESRDFSRRALRRSACAWVENSPVIQPMIAWELWPLDNLREIQPSAHLLKLHQDFTDRDAVLVIES